ncbi:hypothetical protein AB0J48_20735 [Nocardia salmonicida]|uniref:hypothetical protein n=1 Tax=Nocardia salmonicida TaxID=53431 RepID=UPI003439A14E
MTPDELANHLEQGLERVHRAAREFSDNPRDQCAHELGGLQVVVNSAIFDLRAMGGVR